MPTCFSAVHAALISPLTVPTQNFTSSHGLPCRMQIGRSRTRYAQQQHPLSRSLLTRFSTRQLGDIRLCRHVQGSFCRPPTRRVSQRVEATVALQGIPGLLIGLGAFLAGAALAAFLVTAIPVLLVRTDTLCITPAGRHIRMAIRL